MKSAARKSSLQDNSNMNATVTSTNVTKPKRRSLVERELETNMTAKVTTAASGSEGRASTSRYGRTRRLKIETEFSGIEKSPSKISTPVKSPAYKMYASNSANKIDSREVTIPIKIEDQIETIYSKNLSLSRFGSVENTNSPAKKFSKVYTRKDLIQGKEREETSSASKNMFSPSKSPYKPSTNTHLSNILERSEKCSLDSVEKYTAHSSDSAKRNVHIGTPSVVKTLDFDSGKKAKKEVKSTISKSEIFEIEAQCSYQVGDLAWGRVGSYPFWPCIVTRDPYSGTFVKRKLFGRVERDVLHVTFFGDNGRRGWIVENMMRRYSGLKEFHATKDNITPEDKKKDPRYYAAFFISEKKLNTWADSVDEADILLREPKRLRIDFLNEMINKYRDVKITPKRQRQSGVSLASQHNRTGNDVSLSETLYDTLFSEDDSKTYDQAKSKNRPRKTSLDVSEVVTACLDNIAAKTGISKIQKQSHMDRWLQKAKSKTPEKPQSILFPSKVKETKTVAKKARNNSVKLEQQKKPFDEVTPNKSYSPKKFASDSHLYDSLGSIRIIKAFQINEHDYSKLSDCDPEIKLENIPAADVDTTDKNKCGIGFISKVETLCDKPEERPENQVDCANCEIEMSVTTDDFLVTELENESSFAETDIATELEGESDVVTELKDKSNSIKSDVVTKLGDNIDVVTSQDENYKLYLIKTEAAVLNEVSTSSDSENDESQISGKIPSDTIVSPSSVTFKLSTKGLNIVIEANNSFEETSHPVTTNEEMIRTIDYNKKRDNVCNEPVLPNGDIEEKCAYEYRTTIDDILERELSKTSKNKETKRYDEEINAEVYENSQSHMSKETSLIESGTPIISEVNEGSNKQIPIKTIKKSYTFDTKQTYPKVKSHGSDIELEVLDIDKEDKKSFDDIIEHSTDKTTSRNIIKIASTKEIQDLQTAQENASEFPMKTAQSNLIAKDISNASLEIPIIFEVIEGSNAELPVKTIKERNTVDKKETHPKVKSHENDMALQVLVIEKSDEKSSDDIIEHVMDKTTSGNTIENCFTKEIPDLQMLQNIANKFSKNQVENASDVIIKTAQSDLLVKDISNALLETPIISEVTEDSNEEILVKTIEESNNCETKQKYLKVESEKRDIELEVYGREKEDKKSSHDIIELCLDKKYPENKIKNASSNQIQELQTVEDIADKFAKNHEENASELLMKTAQCNLIGKDISIEPLETPMISEVTEDSNEEILIKTMKENNTFDTKQNYPKVSIPDKFATSHKENVTELLMKTARCDLIGSDISNTSLETPSISEFTEGSNEEILIKTIKKSNIFDIKQKCPKVKSENSDMGLEVFGREKEDKKSHDIIELGMDKKTPENIIKNASTKEIQDLLTVEDIDGKFSKNHEGSVSELPIKTAQSNLIDKDITNISMKTNYTNKNKTENSKYRRKQIDLAAKTEIYEAKNDPEFMKYFVMRQDALIDENPHLTEDDVLSYLYKTWLYEIDRKSDYVKCDEIKQSNLVQGVSPKSVARPKKVKKFNIRRKNRHDTSTIDEKPVKNSIDFLSKIPIVKLSKIVNGDGIYPKEKNHAKAVSKCEEKQRRKWIRIKNTSDGDQIADSEPPENRDKLDVAATNTLFQVKAQIVPILDQTEEPVISEKIDTNKDLESIEVQEVLSNGEVKHEKFLLDATVEDKLKPNLVNKQNLNLNVTEVAKSKVPPINLINIPLVETNKVICEDKSSHIINMLDTSLQKPNSKTASPCLKANYIDPAIKQEISVFENQTSYTSETENMISPLNVDQKSETVSVASSVEDNIPLADISKNAIKQKYSETENERVLNDHGIETKLKRSRGRPKKKTEIDTFRENAEFMKYVEMRQDALIDEYPHFTENDIIMYLYKTWTYEENLKSDHVKNDEIDQANLVKGLGDTIATKSKKFKVISNSKELKIYITAEKSETDSIKSDIEDNIPISEIPKSVKDTEKITVSPDKIKEKPRKKQKAQDNILSKKIDIEKAKEDPEFLKYLGRHQDSLIDENPHVSEADIISYLYKTWVYEEDLKSDHMKNDDMELSNLVKGLGDVPEHQQKRLKKKIKQEKASQPTEVVSPNDKPKRKVAKAYYNEDDTDIETELKIFEIFKMKPKIQLTPLENPAIEPSCSQESQSKLSQEKVVKVDPEQVKQESEEVEEEYDEVECFFEELTAPKPNVFKGLTRERVCEICERTNNLVKCKGPCAGMFHLECVKKEDEPVVLVQPIKTRGRKKKKPRGLGRKSRSLDDSESQSDEKHDNVDEQNMSIDDSQEHIIIDLDSFEAQTETKMKEMIEIDTNPGYDSYESDNESNWKDTIAGKCEIVDVKPKPKQIDPTGFKCNNCQKYDTPICFVCKSTTSPKNHKDLRQKCQVAHCHKYYHLECLEHWPQTQFNSGEPSRNNKKISEHFEALSCPRHVCHTCVCDDPRGCKTRFSGDKLARCVRCPATYHSFTKCLPAGTTILSGSLIICPRHYEHRPGKVPCHVNTGWCFICALGGTLICCEYCPTSFHAECLNIAPPEGNYMCEDCETGRLPLYGEMVWVKLGHYRWWPGIILHPFSIPENIMSVKHSRGEFVVRFFGQYDHYWVNRGRVFPFQEGDNGRVSSQRSKIDEAFTVAIEHATRACEILKKATPNEVEDTDIASSLLPPHYVKLKVNKPCGPLLTWRPDDEENSLTLCECDPRESAPCGPDTHCLNRMLLTECGPTCRAGDRCHNRSFEKRLYPKLVPYRTPHRGWGLKTLEDIKQGQFVIEYVGELIDEDEFKRRMQRKHEIRDENFYFLTLDKDRMIDAGPKGNLARFMNHCCEPNCETQKWTVLGDVRVGLFALKDIPANSEVTFNYNLECAGIDKKKCMCGARRCSGYIGAKPKQLLEDIQPKKIRLPKRKYNKKPKKTEDSPSTSKTKVKKQPKPKELTEIEKDLLIIKNATNNSTPCSDSECGGRLSSIDKEEKAVQERPKTLKRKRVSFSTEEVIFYNSEMASVKRAKIGENSVCNQVGD